MMEQRRKIREGIEINLSKIKERYNAIDDKKYLNEGIFQIIVYSNSLDNLIVKAEKSKRSYRIFQYNPNF